MRENESHIHLCRTRSTRTQQFTLTLHVSVRSHRLVLCIVLAWHVSVPLSRSVRCSGAARFDYLQELATLPEEEPQYVVSDQTFFDTTMTEPSSSDCVEFSLSL